MKPFPDNEETGFVLITSESLSLDKINKKPLKIDKVKYTNQSKKTNKYDSNFCPFIDYLHFNDKLFILR